MELVRVTEAAAMAASRWMGRGDKNGADGAAVAAMRTVLPSVPMDGIVVIGEGEKDEAPMLAVIGVSERGSMFNPGPCVYMEKLAVGAEAAGVIDPLAPPAANLEAVAKAKGESIRDITAVILDRDRHADLIREVRAAGARVRLIQDGDVAGAMSTAWPDTGADILFGIGGSPEGVLAACAHKCMGGALYGKLWPRNDEERRAALDAGYDLDAILTLEDLVRGDNCFFAATGVTDGDTTHSLVMRSKSGTVREIKARHRIAKLRQFASVEYG